MQTCWKCGGNIKRGEGIKTKTDIARKYCFPEKPVCIYEKHWHKNCYKLATKEEKK